MGAAAPQPASIRLHFNIELCEHGILQKAQLDVGSRAESMRPVSHISESKLNPLPKREVTGREAGLISYGFRASGK